MEHGTFLSRFVPGHFAFRAMFKLPRINAIKVIKSDGTKREINFINIIVHYFLFALQRKKSEYSLYLL